MMSTPMQSEGQLNIEKQLLSTNITTKTLSPRISSENFGIYLDNIQILQNASNVLTDPKLIVITLSNIFNKTYGPGRLAMNDLRDKVCYACEMCTVCLSKCHCEQNYLSTNSHQEFWELTTNYQ